MGVAGFTFTGTVAQASSGSRNGQTVGVSAMSNAQLAQYFFTDTSLGTVANAGPYSGLKDKLADGRLGADVQDWADAVFIRSQLLSQN
jgi:hypothetical protein